MAYIEVKNQSELDAALKKQSVIDGRDLVACIGSGSFRVTGSSRVVARESSSVVARESSSVVAWESSRVVARESSSVVAWGSSSVVAWESSSVVAWGSSRVVAWGSSSVVARESSRVVARESSSVVARESSRVVASPLVAVHKHVTEWDAPSITGGVMIEVPRIKTVEQWAEFNGLEIKRGWLTVYKAVDDELKSGRDFAYPIGQEVKCDDWKEHNDCGNGLHFSQAPSLAKGYYDGATRFLACKVKVSEAVYLSSDKIKAPRCKVIGEVEEFMATPIEEVAA